MEIKWNVGERTGGPPAGKTLPVVDAELRKGWRDKIGAQIGAKLPYKWNKRHEHSNLIEKSTDA